MLWMQGCHKGPENKGPAKVLGAQDIPPALDAEMSHQATTARWGQVLLTCWSHQNPVSAISLWDEPMSSGHMGLCPHQCSQRGHLWVKLLCIHRRKL